MQHYKLANNGLKLPNQSAPNWPRIRAAMALPTMSPAEAAQCAPGTAVKVRGVVRAGDGGPLTAPISGQQCAWYRSYVQPGNWLLKPLPPAGRVSDIMLVAQPGGTIFWRRYDQTDEISETPFYVAAADGPGLRIDPRVADVNSTHLARNRVITSRFGQHSQLLVEFVLPVGTEVVLLGEIGERGELTSQPNSLVFVSTRSDAEIVDRAAHAVVGERGTTLSSFRFVRRGNAFVRVMTSTLRIGAVVFAVAVVAFIVYALIAF